ncbi:TetR family transcriptional regulator, partial [Actinomadura sp. HBU206391]|uniref:TetR family transcriptional regulator n=1 Tax=Actinomadura sp. HBU206391 TaxID=2731692 RepID=UPI001650C256
MTVEPTVTGRQGVRSRGQHERRKRIVQAAAALASRGGVEKMQMRTVADRAGVALGTLYRYFPSKMDLVVAVVSEELDSLEGSLNRRPPASSTPPSRAIDVLMRATRGLMREPELADALIRSLLLSNVKTDFGDRMSGLLLRASVGGDVEVPEDDRRRSLVGALSSVWIMEMIEMLRGHATGDEVQARLEVAADRLL